MKHLINASIFPLFISILICFTAIADNLQLFSFTLPGIIPGTKYGLIGIATAPLIHANYQHLLSNIFPFIILSTMLFLFYKKIAFSAFLWMYIWPSILTWISAREGNHIGASGLIYALSSFLIFIGFLKKNTPSIAISFLVIFLYGSLVWGIFPYFSIKTNISWEGHLWGTITGIILAFFYRKKGSPNKNNNIENEDEDEIEDSDNNSEAYWNIHPSDEIDSNEKIKYYYPKGFKN